MDPNSPDLPPTAAPPRLYIRRGGRPLCVVCLAAPHLSTCPIVQLSDLTRDLAAQIGTFVADARDTLTTMERLLTHAEKETRHTTDDHR